MIHPKVEIELIGKKIPTIIIPYDYFLDTLFIRQISDKDEIMWLSLTTEDEEKNTITLNHTLIFKQKVNTIACIHDPEDLALYASKCCMEGRPELYKNMYCWSHFHPFNGTSPSPDDINQMNIFTKHVKKFFIRAIYGQGDNIDFSYFNYQDGYIVNHCPWIISKPNDQHYLELEATIKEKVSPIPLPAPVVIKKFNYKEWRKKNGYVPTEVLDQDEILPLE